MERIEDKMVVMEKYVIIVIDGIYVVVRNARWQLRESTSVTTSDRKAAPKAEAHAVSGI